MTDIEKIEMIINDFEKQLKLNLRYTSDEEERENLKKLYLGNIQTFKNVKSALEKQIPKKPTPQIVKGGKRLIGNGWWCNGTTVYKCPCCDSWITLTYKHCIDCGQALDWGDRE